MSTGGDVRMCKRCGRSVMRSQCRPSRKGGHVCLDCLRAQRRSTTGSENMVGKSGRKRRGPSQQVLGDAASVVLVGLLAAVVMVFYWALF